MRRFPGGSILAAGLLLTLGTAAVSAQEEVTRTEIRRAQVVYVAPNILVVRGKDGIRRFTPENWTNIRVEKDGQMISPDQLQKGDIVTATIITKAAPRELTAEELKAYDVEGVTTAASGELVSEKVIWTEVRRGKVVYVSPDVLLIKEANGVRKFTPADWKDTKVEKDGRMIEPGQLQKGDIVTATFITKAVPSIVSAREEKEIGASAAPALSAPPGPKPVRAPAPKPAAAARAAESAAPSGAESTPGRRLPKTASAVPAVGLSGVAWLALGGALALTRRLRAAR